MATDALRLLFELDVDGRAGAAGLLKFRKDIAATVAVAGRAVKDAASKAAVVPDLDKKFRDSQKEFQRRVAAESRRNEAAAESLQRQRSTGIVRELREQ